MEPVTAENSGLRALSDAANGLCGEFIAVLEEYLSSGTMPAEWHEALAGGVQTGVMELSRLLGAFHDILSSVRRAVLVGPKGTDPFGAVSTPPEIARSLVRESLDLLGRPAKTIVDPAIGSGIFLAALAAENALDDVLFIGVDTDPVALCLSSFLVSRLKESGHVPASATIKLVQGDALAGITIRELELLSRKFHVQAIQAKKNHDFNRLEALLSYAGAILSTGSKHVLRAAPVVRSAKTLEILAPGIASHLRKFRDFMPVHWDTIIGSLPERGADLVIGNPPWGLLSGRGSPLKKMREHGHDEQARMLEDRVKFYRHRFNEITGHMLDLHKWFVTLAARILAEDGVAGYVIPDSVLHYPSFSDLRAHLAAHYDTGTARLLKPFGGRRTSTCTLVLRGGNANTAKLDVTDRENRQISLVIHDDGHVTRPGSLLDDLADWPRLSDLVDIREGSHAIASPRSWEPASGGLRVVDVSRLQRFRTPPVTEIRTARQVPESHLVSGDIGLWRKTGDRPVTAVIRLDKPAVIHQNVYLFRITGFSPYALTVFLNSKACETLYRGISWVRSSGAMAQFRLSHIRMLPVPPFSPNLTALDRSSRALQLVSIGEMLHNSILTWLQDGDADEIAAMSSDALPRMLEGLKQGSALLLRQSSPDVIPRTIHTIFHLTGLALHESEGTTLHAPLVAFAEDMVNMLPGITPADSSD